MASCSDADLNDSLQTDDPTTDDEFFTELMNTPAQFEDCLIPENSPDVVQAINHLSKCLNRRFHAYPVVYSGSLSDALKAACGPKILSERSPLLVYINNDKSIATNLFCKKLLCNEQIIEYLMNNYLLWAWDVTFEPNAKKLDDMLNAVFGSKAREQHFDYSSVDQCPLLIGIFRDERGAYSFARLVDDSKRGLNLDEFLARLMDFKETFHSCEQKLADVEKEDKLKAHLMRMNERDLAYHSKRSRHPEFLRAMSLLPGMQDHEAFSRDPGSFMRLASFDHRMRHNYETSISRHAHTVDDIGPQFAGTRLDSDDGDDEGDDDNDRTPTVNRPRPTFQ